MAAGEGPDTSEEGGKMDSCFKTGRMLAIAAVLALLAGSAVAKAPPFETGNYKGKTEKGGAFSAKVGKKYIKELKVTLVGTCQINNQPPKAQTVLFPVVNGTTVKNPLLKIHKHGKFGGEIHIGGPPPRTKGQNTVLKGKVKGNKISGSLSFDAQQSGSGGSRACVYPKMKFKGTHK
jgi:hypothetical protein